jgi:hypothetical protein
MKYLKKYSLFESSSSEEEDISQETIDYINDVLLDLLDNYPNVSLCCWMETESIIDRERVNYHSWEDVNEFVVCSSISFSIKPSKTYPVSNLYSKSRSYYLSKDEATDMVETIKRISNYLKSLKNEMLSIYLHYESKDRHTMNQNVQREINLKDIDNLLNNYSFVREDGTERGFLYEISMTINTNESTGWE